MASEFIRIPGWYLEDSVKDRRKDSAAQEATGNVRLGSSYVKSIRRFNLKDLEVTDARKYAGHFFNPRVVRGIVDLSNGGSLVKFYIEEVDVRELEGLIRFWRRRENEILLGSHRY